MYGYAKYSYAIWPESRLHEEKRPLIQSFNRKPEVPAAKHVDFCQEARTAGTGGVRVSGGVRMSGGAHAAGGLPTTITRLLNWLAANLLWLAVKRVNRQTSPHMRNL